MGAVDWDRRLFDSLVPLPEGTSYNAYLVEGSEHTALLDTVDPSMCGSLMAQLAGVERLDYVVAHHAEQDHSGSIPMVLERYPEAKVVCSPKCAPLLRELLHIGDDRFLVVQDNDALDLGGRTLRFIHAPWVHWPETMFSYLEEEKILFSCDFLGSHLATNELFCSQGAREVMAAKRYFAEIILPFANHVVKHLDRLSNLDISMVCPSHGPIWAEPQFIMGHYRNWSSGPMANKVCIPFVSMHGSTLALVDRLVDALTQRGIEVERFELTGSDTGLLATSLIDSATVVIATPTVLGGAHPAAASAAFLANALRPRTRFLSVMMSFSWGGRTLEQLSAMVGNIKAELIEPLQVRGLPRAEDFEAVDALAQKIAAAHVNAGIMKLPK